MGIWVAAVAFYTATAILTGEVWNHVSPWFPAHLHLRDVSFLLWFCMSRVSIERQNECGRLLAQEYLPLGHMRKTVAAAPAAAAGKNGRHATNAPAQPTIAENK